MKYQTIHIEGTILSADILDKIEQSAIAGQKPIDFGTSNNVKDDIANAWADAQSYWSIYQRRIAQLNINQSGVTETRNHWIVPLLGLLGYGLEVQQKGKVVNNKNYHISHRDNTRDKDSESNLGYPVHIMGCNDELDRKRQDSGPRMSPHGLLQEYLNLTEHLYGIVTNGLRLRLLRDSSRLIKLSYIEFDLDRMMQENHYADFAIMYRLLHASRMPVDMESSAESFIELFHQESLESGSRIRDGLSDAVEKCIVDFANGFLSHPENESLRELIRSQILSYDDFYHYQLRLIYRLLFLMVIEERDLVFPKDADRKKRDIYYNYYSINRLRKLAGKRYLADAKYKDYWISLKNTFKLFENTKYGKPLGIKPLAGELFGWHALGELTECAIDNSVIITCLSDLSIFTNPVNNQTMRVNYGALNVEEFGSVYEGLLEYDPVIDDYRTYMKFSFEAGNKRSSSGSHYTPDELVQPLIKHSLEYVIEDKLKEAKEIHNSNPDKILKHLQEEKLLSITVCDVACGSGHILLNAARRIATELALVRTGEEQPSPKAFRAAIRDVICNCIYGVDLNPLAVELCKVALWLEAHNPNEPLNFLDHHIKCGNAIVGLAHKEELERGIANEAFKKLPGDDKGIISELSKRNKKEIKNRTSGYRIFNFEYSLGRNLQKALQKFNNVTSMPEKTPPQIEAKTEAYKALQDDLAIHDLQAIADIQVAQFFIPKTEENKQKIITDEKYFRLLAGENTLQGQAVAQAQTVAFRKRFFHWFLEFPEIMNNGGFDCILGNPPFLGGMKLSTNYGPNFLNFIHCNYFPAKGTCDLAGYFFRRVFSIIKKQGFQGLISTNTIAQGDTRESSLVIIEKENGSINFAIRSTKWPGLAAVEVALLTIYKGDWNRELYLDNKPVSQITTYLDDTDFLGEPYKLNQNDNRSFIGSYVLGKGFILTPEKTQDLINRNPKNHDVLFPYLNGDDLNSSITQSTNRWVIYFGDWPLKRDKLIPAWGNATDKEKTEYLRSGKVPLDYTNPVASDYPECLDIIERLVKPERDLLWGKGNATADDRAKRWWQFARQTINLYSTISPLKKTLTMPRVTKYCIPTFSSTGIVASEQVVVFAFDKYSQYCLLSNTFHTEWAWKNCSTMGGVGLRYSPTDAFQTYTFPQEMTEHKESQIEQIGKEYYEYRCRLMVDLQLGLTKTYNQFHNKNLCKLEGFIEIRGKTIYVSAKNILIDGKKAKNNDLEKYLSKDTVVLWNHLHKDEIENTIYFNEAVDRISKLRDLHKQMDEAVLEAYGWHVPSEAGPAINLAHDFYEVDYLPENDRTRYTISPEARKEILKRLLLLNHKTYDQEVAQGLHDKKSKKKKKATKKVVKEKADAISTIILPETPRESIDGDSYAIEFIANLLLNKGGTQGIDGLVTAYTQVWRQDIMRENIPEGLGYILPAWSNSFKTQQHPSGSMIDILVEMAKNKTISIDKDLNVKLNVNPFDLPDNVWIKTDAKLCQVVADNIPELLRSIIPNMQKIITEVKKLVA